VLLVLFSHSPPEVWPGAKGENRTLIEHLLPAASANPVEHVVEGWNAGPVAGSTLTSVNDHVSLPQLVTVALIVVLVPTVRLPNVRTSGLMQNLPCAATLDVAPRLISTSRKLRMGRTAPRAAAGLTRMHYRPRAAPQLFGKPGIEPPVRGFGMRSGMREWPWTVRRPVDDGIFFGWIDRISSAGQRSDPAHFPLRLSPRRSGDVGRSYGCVPGLNISPGPKMV
jgi:hypothetical protein